MKIEAFLIKNFTEAGNEVITLDVPTGSILRKIVLLHDGIYGYFEIPELQMNSTERIRYKLLTVNNPIVPEGAEFVDIVDVVIELEMKKGETVVARQAVQVIPIYKLLN